MKKPLVVFKVLGRRRLAMIAEPREVQSFEFVRYIVVRGDAALAIKHVLELVRQDDAPDGYRCIEVNAWSVEDIAYLDAIVLSEAENVVLNERGSQ